MGDESTDIQFSRALGRFATGFAVDGVGDLKPPIVPNVLITTDTIPGDATTTQTVTVTPVGGAITDNDIISTIDTIGDEDFFKVTLTAGTAYEFHLYSYGPPATSDVGPSGSGLTDPYLELYAPDGTTMLVSADGGADTVYNEANSGFDVLLVYTPTESGTFYINARAFSNSPATDNGDSVGDYQLAVRVQDPNDPTVYHPYYTPDEPLYAIDWGTQVNKVNQSARNPDGDEGIRSTGNAQGTPTYGTNFEYDANGDGTNEVYATAAALAAAQGKDITGKNVITIYFAKEGDIFVSNDPTNPGLPPATITAVAIQDFEFEAVFDALGEFEKVADIIYLEVDNRDDADFIYTSYQGTPGPGVSLLGSMSPPDESDEGLAQFNSGDERWNERDLEQGGFSFVTLIHEFGHGHGLAHPHDNGGHSGIMHGVEEESPFNYTTGDYELNQGVFTMMSYEDGWQSSPYGNAPTNVGYGYLGGLSAFDIAAIQDKYGVNENTAAGDNTYVLKDVNAAGTYFTAIWDVGGNDSIVYGGTRNANIDLRAASLQYEFGGGGWVSYAFGIFGGFTIANAVVIENALSGAGNDTLIGNAVANYIDGGAGVDQASGGAGNDSYVVDNVGDVVTELANEGTDVVYARSDYTLTAGSHVEFLAAISQAATGAMQLIGNEFANAVYGNNGANFLDGGGGIDSMTGFGGDDKYVVDDVTEVVAEGVGGGTDIVYARGSYTLSAGAEVEVLSAVSQSATTAMTLVGNGLAQTIYGNAGANYLDGGGGADVLIGLGGNDVYVVDGASDYVGESAGGGRDVVYTSATYALGAGEEIEVLSTISTSGTTAINLTGNGLSNEIYGNAGVNTINGGAGADYLMGFAGADTFQFTTALGGGNIDAILDFATGTDKIALDDAVFTGLAPGALSAGAFVTGTQAGDADDRIIYNSATGQLFFDADGNGAGAAVQFATLSTGLSLAASDFTVI
ncbi:MAG TPA: M10 family metallopeptidase C-terminal domain-containing protein [Allosphingosinicella sp.]|nr:M10 family metallopeptidase C-terminal domain-containing protein [Allosphingosinicella sp.]